MRSVAGLIRRRGQIVKWYHATSASGADIDPLTQNPRLTAGGPRTVAGSVGQPMTGPTGEQYPDEPVLVRAYMSKKVSSAFSQIYGILDQNDAQLDLAVPFAPEPELGIKIEDKRLLEAYERGAFVQYPRRDDRLVARDKFTIAGLDYIVKSRAVPLVDANRVVAWRLLIGAITY